MRALGVGDTLYPERSLPEGIAVDATSTWLVVVALAGIEPADIVAVTRGALDLAIDRDGPMLRWCVRVAGCLDWSACAWAWWERTAPEVPSDTPGVGGVVGVLLCDATTTQVRARRTVGLTVRVADALRALEREAQDVGRDEAACTRARQWARTAEASAVEAVARRATVVTGVPARG